MFSFRYPLLIGGLCAIVWACAPQNAQEEIHPEPPASSALQLPSTLFEYGAATYPKHLREALAQHDNTPPDNPTTNAGATLGRVLFYEKNLSLHRNIACNSCHLQEKAFTDGEAFSLGFDRVRTARNSMSLLNLRMYDRGHMFWDERAATLEEQVIQPILDPVEMGLSRALLLERLEAQAYYPPLFEAAFGDAQITEKRVAYALAQFLRSMMTYRSKYDSVVLGQAQFTALERQGQQLFNTVGAQQGCISCHGGSIGDIHSYHFQISQIPTAQQPHDLDDLGLYAHTGQASDRGRFKTSSLRNIVQTAPYLHDGHAATLHDLFAPGASHHFALQPQEIKALIAFLGTLTDKEITRDVRFSSPFKK